jgi:SAM-dependent methyltransferase
MITRRDAQAARANSCAGRASISIGTQTVKTGDEARPQLKENLWGYGKRLRFVDDTIREVFPGELRGRISVLDVGCGNGSQLAAPLAEAGYEVTGIDPHLPSILRGRQRSPRVHFVHGAVDELPLRSFHCVLVSEVLEHLSDPEDLLRSVLPYVDAAGVLIVTVPNGFGAYELDARFYRISGMAGLVDRLYPAPAEEIIGSTDDQSPHIQRFTPGRMLGMFQRHDLRLLAARGTSIASGPMVLHALGRFEAFVRLNAMAADWLPWQLASGWMFALQKGRVQSVASGL